MGNTSEECCDPKVEKLRQTGKHTSGGNNLSRMFSFKDIANPIPDEIRDPESYKKTFGKNAFIPYAGTDSGTAHSLLKWLNSMKYLSPTHGACVESIKTYTLGALLDIVRVPSLSFDVGYGFGKPQKAMTEVDPEEGLTIKQKEAFSKFLMEEVSYGYHGNPRALMESCYDSNDDNGNYWLELKMVDVNGQKKSSLHYHPAETVCYLATKPNGPRICGVSTSWESGHLANNPARQVPVYPAMRVRDGVTTTMIHVKQGNYIWYGRPTWMSAFMYVYREFQDANYLIKQAANNFVGQVLIEVEESQVAMGGPFSEGSAKEAGFDNVAHRMKQNFTASAEDPMTMMLISRPHGAKPAFVHQFKPNTNEQFYKVSSEIAELKIIRAHQWSKRFLGENQTQGFSANVFIDELKVKEAAMLNAKRLKCAEGINIALKLIVDFHGKEEFKDFGVYGKNNLDLLTQFLTDDELGDSNGGKTQESANTVGGDNLQPTK